MFIPHSYFLYYHHLKTNSLRIPELGAILMSFNAESKPIVWLYIHKTEVYFHVLSI